MSHEPRSLRYKFLQPRRNVSGKPPALILLHGRGADEDDLLGLSEYFDDRLLIIAPRAPYPFANGSGFTWYDLEEIGRPDAAMFRSSYDTLLTFIAEATEHHGLDPRKLYCGGFSMGSIMSLALALTRPELLAGVIANSGYVPEDAGLTFRWEGVKGRPFFVAHGIYDPVIPFAYSRRAKELLESHGAIVTYREYDMGHQINENSLNDMMAWFTPLLDR